MCLGLIAVDQSNSNLPVQNQVMSEVELSKIPLEKRWQYIEAELRANGLDEKDETKLNQYFADYYTALYYIFKDKSAGAYMVRALLDTSQPILDERRNDSQSIPLFDVMLSCFLGKSSGAGSFAELRNYLKANAAVLQVMLPGYALKPKFQSCEFYRRVLNKVNYTDMLYLLNGMCHSAFELLMRTEYKPRFFNKKLAAERFLESYGVEDPLGSLYLAKVDIKDTLRRFSRYLKEDSMIESDSGAAKTIKVDRRRREPYVQTRTNAVPVVQNLLDMLALQLQVNGLPALTYEQQQLTAMYILMRLEVWPTPILCENRPEQAQLQGQESSFAYLKELESSFFENMDLFSPAQLLHYHDPREVFGNCIYDTLNDFVMPLNAQEEHPAFADEQTIKAAVHKAIEKDTPCLKLEFRKPQEMGDEFEHEIWYGYSLESLDLGLLEYHGKQPMQGWKMVLCRTYYTVTKADAKESLSLTAERFKQVRTHFFEDQAEELMSNQMYQSQELDVVSVLKEHLLDNYSLGVLVGTRGTMPGLVRIWSPHEENEGMSLVDGQYLDMPQLYPSSKQNEVYLTTLPCEMDSLLQLLCLSDFGEKIQDFYHHVHAKQVLEQNNALLSEQYQEFDGLRNLMMAILRNLHTRQNNDNSQVPIHIIKDLMQMDFYYQLDGVVLTALLYDMTLQLVVNAPPRTRKGKTPAEENLEKKTLAESDELLDEESSDKDDYGLDEDLDESLLDEFDNMIN